MSQQNKDTILRVVSESFVGGDVTIIDELYAPDYRDHSLEHAQMWGALPDREGFKKLIEMVREGLSGLQAETDLMISEGDLVSARVLATGNHSGNFMGIPATGKEVRLSDWHYWRFDSSGKVAEHWNQSNALEVLQELGVISRVPAPTGEAGSFRNDAP